MNLYQIHDKSVNKKGSKIWENVVAKRILARSPAVKVGIKRLLGTLRICKVFHLGEITDGLTMDQTSGTANFPNGKTGSSKNRLSETFRNDYFF